MTLIPISPPRSRSEAIPAMPMRPIRPPAPAAMLPSGIMLSLVVAVAQNGVIGQGGGLPWHLPGDLRHFRRITMGKPLIMGRKTWDSLPRKPLPGRANIVLTGQPGWMAEGAQVTTTFADALTLAARAAKAQNETQNKMQNDHKPGAHKTADHKPEICVIGGAAIFDLALPLAERIYLTRIDTNPAGDVFFPALNHGDWHETAGENVPAEGDAPQHGFYCLSRRINPS